LFLFRDRPLLSAVWLATTIIGLGFALLPYHSAIKRWFQGTATA
jgi:hypothetical protein